MPALTLDRLATLLQPYLAAASSAPAPETLIAQLSLYLDLLLKWNARTNLTAIRDPETIVTRHFGESLFLAAHLPPDTHTVLDLGSGAGFPGLPLQLLRPDLAVTLAESQQKKAAFLQEVIRSLGLSTSVHNARAETLLVVHPPFDVVTLRAVDNMPLALDLARKLGTHRLLLSTAAELDRLRERVSRHPIPNSITGVLASF